MNTTLPTGRRGQIFAVAGLAIVLIMLWLGVVAPLLDWHAARADAIGQQRVLTEHLAALAARLPVLEVQARRDAGHAQSAEDATDARAGADLQQQIEAMAAKAGAHLSQVEFLQPEPADGYRLIQIRITLTDHYPVLISLIAAMGQSIPPLFIDDLHLRTDDSEDSPTPKAEMTFVVIMPRTVPAPASRAPA